jgi:hypothetical protein
MEQDQNRVPDDPLRERAARGVRFRADDPPDVREALVSAAAERERQFFRESLESQGPHDQ